MTHQWQDYESIDHSHPSDPAFFAGHSEDDPPNYRPEYTAMAIVKAGALIILCGIAALAIMGAICM